MCRRTQVAKLERPVEVLACAMGYTLDLNIFDKGKRASLTGCQQCPSSQYGLWKDSRPNLSKIKIDTSSLSSDGFSDNVIRLYLQTMNDTVHAADYECKPCPTNALCLGGAVVVPQLGKLLKISTEYWCSPNTWAD
jgi:hypothetical protein